MKSLVIKLVVFLICCGILSGISSTPCFAHSQGRKGKLGFGIKDIISGDALVIGGRYWLSDGMSLDGNLGIHYRDPDNGDSESQFLIGVGLNQYLRPGESFSPFFGADFSINIDDPGPGDTISMFNIDGKFGGEYFFTEHFSLSGAVSFGLHFGDDTEIGTDGRLGVFYYLN